MTWGWTLGSPRVLLFLDDVRATNCSLDNDEADSPDRHDNSGKDVGIVPPSTWGRVLIIIGGDWMGTRNRACPRNRLADLRTTKSRCHKSYTVIHYVLTWSLAIPLTWSIDDISSRSPSNTSFSQDPKHTDLFSQNFSVPTNFKTNALYYWFHHTPYSMKPS